MSTAGLFRGCVRTVPSLKGLVVFFGLYPGLTPWANIVSPRRGSLLARVLPPGNSKRALTQNLTPWTKGNSPLQGLSNNAVGVALRSGRTLDGSKFAQFCRGISLATAARWESVISNQLGTGRGSVVGRYANSPSSTTLASAQASVVWGAQLFCCGSAVFD